MTTINPIGRDPGRRIRHAPRSRRRDPARTRALVTLAILIVLAAAAVVLTLRWEAARSRAPAAAPCTPAGTASPLAPSAVRVRVLNATARNGLAASVAAELRRRGYTVTGVGNDAGDVSGPAEVRFGPTGARAGQTVSALVPGAASRRDTRPGGDVDLVLGNRFRALAPAGKPAAPASDCPAPATPTG